MEDWHHQFSRFEPDSELSQLNADDREVVPVSPMMVRFVEGALGAAAVTNGLVDPTLVTELETAGYHESLSGQQVSAPERTPPNPDRRPARSHPQGRWRQVRVDRRAGTVTRPRGVRFDSGGIVKGLVGDVLAELLGVHQSFAIDAAGDLRFGGTSGQAREVRVASPFEDALLHTFELATGAAATSGILKRSWLDARGRLAHHLLDPATGRPAFTGVVQATALAPTAIVAETLSKAALLSGYGRAVSWLAYGGVVVYDDGCWGDPGARRGGAQWSGLRRCAGRRARDGQLAQRPER